MAPETPFTKLERLLSTTATSSNHPALRHSSRQYFCDSLSSAGTALRHHLGSVPHLVVFVDGRAKRCLEGATGDADTEVAALLNAFAPSVVWINAAAILGVPHGDVHASAHHLDTIQGVLREHPDAAIAVLGSGSLTDLVKHAAFLNESRQPLLSIPTALTVTAYSSSFSVLDWHGAKRTKPSRQPDATFWTAPILRAAPSQLNRAGYGDLLAKYCAYGDWYLAHFFGLTNTYTLLPFELMDSFSSELRQLAPLFSDASLSIEAIGEASAILALAGIAMNVAGETTPLSGFEHVVSHGLDFLRLQSGRPLALHGEQVALGALASTRCFDWFLNRPVPTLDNFSRTRLDESTAILNSMMLRAPFFGADEAHLTPDERRIRIETMSESLESARHQFELEARAKQQLWATVRDQLPARLARWSELRATLRELTVRSDTMLSVIREATLPLSPEELAPATTATEFRWALRFSPFIRKRLSIGDLCFWLGEDPAMLAE
jgi:glycerol-1-phosphate dehydrogenase [NAD(P)+]